jgi:hypothetical protein
MAARTWGLVALLTVAVAALSAGSVGAEGLFRRKTVEAHEDGLPHYRREYYLAPTLYRLRACVHPAREYLHGLGPYADRHGHHRGPGYPYEWYQPLNPFSYYIPPQGLAVSPH